MRMRGANEDWLATVNAAITADEGIWTCRLCRQLNRLPETLESVIYCGQCADYANPRKRARAEAWEVQAQLPGMEHPFAIHEACPGISLRKLRYMLDVLENTCDLVRGYRERIPDERQARGWDFATRYYIAE